ncbi:putative pentatricopeptide repeat-containing protein, partial [Tanacetum coccineum]
MEKMRYGRIKASSSREDQCNDLSVAVVAASDDVQGTSVLKRHTCVVDEVLAANVQRCMVANAPPYNALINRYCLIGRVDEGRKLFDVMMCDRDVISYNVLINGYCKNDVIDKAIGLMDEMCRLKIDPNVIAWMKETSIVCHDFIRAHTLQPPPKVLIRHRFIKIEQLWKNMSEKLLALLMFVLDEIGVRVASQ